MSAVSKKSIPASRATAKRRMKLSVSR